MSHRCTGIAVFFPNLNSTCIRLFQYIHHAQNCINFINAWIPSKNFLFILFIKFQGWITFLWWEKYFEAEDQRIYSKFLIECILQNLACLLLDCHSNQTDTFHRIGRLLSPDICHKFQHRSDRCCESCIHNLCRNPDQSIPNYRHTGSWALRSMFRSHSCGNI